MDQPHQHNVLCRAEIRHGCSCLKVLYDVLLIQQLVGLLRRDVFIDDTPKELLGGCCQDQREDVIGMIWAKEVAINK